MRKLLFLLCFTILFYSSNVNAMSLTSVSTVLGFDNYTGTSVDCSAPTDMNGAMFSMNGETVSVEAVLNFYNDYGARKNAGGVIKLNGNSETISFPVKKDESAQVYKISSNENRDFLLIRTYSDSANGSSVCTGMWLVGKADGKFVTYVKLNTVENAGLLFDDIYPAVKNGELWITGRARVYWGADQQAPPRPLGSKYDGVPVKVDGNYCSINSAVLFWDSTAQWFGIRMEN